MEKITLFFRAKWSFLHICRRKKWPPLCRLHRPKYAEILLPAIGVVTQWDFIIYIWTIDNNQNENYHATSKAFHWSRLTWVGKKMMDTTLKKFPIWWGNELALEIGKLFLSYIPNLLKGCAMYGKFRPSTVEMFQESRNFSRGWIKSIFSSQFLGQLMISN